MHVRRLNLLHDTRYHWTHLKFARANAQRTCFLKSKCMSPTNGDPSSKARASFKSQYDDRVPISTLYSNICSYRHRTAWEYLASWIPARCHYGFIWSEPRRTLYVVRTDLDRSIVASRVFIGPSGLVSAIHIMLASVSHMLSIPLRLFPLPYSSMQPTSSSWYVH